MATITLAQAQNLTQNQLISGVIESTITVDRFFQLLPFMGITSNAITYNQEDVIGDVGTYAVGDTIDARAASTTTQVTSTLAKIIGDAEVDKFIQITMSNETDQTEQQIMSKAKGAGRKYRNLLINGDTGTTATEFDGLFQLVDATKTIDATATDGDILSFEKLDELLDQVTDKDGQVDAIIMPRRDIRAYKTLLRALGGASPDDVYVMPDGTSQIAFGGVPIFADDWIPTNQTQGGASNASSIFAVNLDDGSHKVGMAGLNAANDFGLSVEDLGTSQTKDEDIWRVKWYSGLALFNKNGAAVMNGIIPA